LSNSFCVREEGTQLVAEFALYLVILFFTAKCFTCIHESVLRGYAGEEQGAEIDNGGGGGDKELVNSANPHSSLIYLLGEGTWADTWCKERKRQPLTGRENTKIPRNPRNGSRSIYVTYREIWPLMS
jgi:hypothetical protein